MPLDLSDVELATAATTSRAMAYQEGARAKAIENPDMRRPIENTVATLRHCGGEVRGGEEEGGRVKYAVYGPRQMRRVR